jgi:hypothetical protein
MGGFYKILFVVLREDRVLRCVCSTADGVDRRAA